MESGLLPCGDISSPAKGMIRTFQIYTLYPNAFSFVKICAVELAAADQDVGHIMSLLVWQPGVNLQELLDNRADVIHINGPGHELLIPRDFSSRHHGPDLHGLLNEPQLVCRIPIGAGEALGRISGRSFRRCRAAGRLDWQSQRIAV